MKCPTCGAENRDDVNQCAYCGQRLAPKIPTQNQSQDPYQQNTYTWNNPQNGQQGGWQNPNNQQWQSQGWRDEANQQWQNNQQYNQQFNPYGYPQRKQNGLALASLILGVVSIVMMCMLWPVAIGMDIAAIVLGIVSLKKRPEGKGMAIAGIVVGGVVLIACAFLGTMTIYLLNDPRFMEMYQQMYQELSQSGML